MKQPDLGKKIAELRKSKGLTQEELVEKCNLNVRTLQRIECGEVTPRSYTIKVIFAALDCSIYDSPKSISSKFSKAEFMISKWLEQVYQYVLALFNLKTHTMKKLFILSVPVLTICLVLFFYCSNAIAQQSKTELRKKFDQTSSNTKFMLWFNSGQIDSIGLTYLENACMMPDNDPTIIGRTGINNHNKQLFDRGIRFVQLNSVSKVVADSIAVDRGVWTVSINAVPVASVTYLTQWHLINGQWMIENEMSKSDKVINTEANK